MKTKHIFLLLVSIFLTSCKLDKKEDNSSATVNEKTDEENTKSKGLKLTFNAKVEKDDMFFIFYNEDGTENFSGDQMVQRDVKGSGEFQDIQFILPEDAMPLNLRFDIGSNKELKQVQFTNFKIDYFGKEFASNQGEFFKYFYPNDQVICDTLTSTAKINYKEGQPFDPIIGGTLYLRNELEKLYK